MFNQFTIASLLDLFRDVYQTVDVRAAVVRDSEEWLLIALVVHLRATSCETAKEEFRRPATEFGAINSAVFRIIQQCHPITEISQLANQLLEQKLTLGDIKVQLTSKCDILSLLCYNSHSDGDAHDRRWPQLEQLTQISNNARAHQLINYDREILRDVAIAGYSDPHAAIRAFLGVRFERNSTPGYLSVMADIPVRLHPVAVRKSGKEYQLSLRVEAHPAIEDLSCAVRQTKHDRSTLVRQELIKLAPAGKEMDRQLWCGNAIVELEKKDDEITIEVLNNKIGKVCSTNIRPFQLLPIEQANPLLAALTHFCPPDEMRRLLENPQTGSVAGKPPTLKNHGTLFEVSIQWLLSALGFRAVWLHAYETLTMQSELSGQSDEGNKIKRGRFTHSSVDCLAYSDSEDILLLVNCTVAAPNPGELTRQADLAVRFSKDLADSKIRVEAVLFSASHAPEAQQPGRLISGVRIFYTEDISKLLDVAANGGSFNYREFVNPLFTDF